jgi:hypothetical protein
LIIGLIVVSSSRPEVCENCSADDSIQYDRVPLVTSQGMIPPARPGYRYLRRICHKCGHTRVIEDRIEPTRREDDDDRRSDGGYSSGQGGAGRSY